MRNWLSGLRHWSTVPLAFALIAGLWLAIDGRMHHDQPSYLYAAAFLSLEQIIAGDVQPSGIPEFIQGRILHVLVLKALVAVTGTGVVGYAVLAAIHCGLLIGFFLITSRVLRDVLPGLRTRPTAVILLALTPVSLYLAFKPMPDVEALAAAAFVTLALVRVGQRVRPVTWILVGSLALAFVALTKNQMVLMPAGFWAAATFIPFAGIDRRRFAVFGALMGLLGIALTILLLEVFGVGLSRYVASYSNVMARDFPLAAQLLSLATLLGALWLLVPVAAFSRHRRELYFLLLWCVFSMAPLLVLAAQFQARHLAPMLIALGGLIMLALEVLLTRSAFWQRLSNARKITGSVVAVVILMASNAVALAVMMHEVEIRELRGLLNSLDQKYGKARYVVMTPWPYTDFHIIRFLWPDIDVRNVRTGVMWVRTSNASERRSHLTDWHDGRFIESIEELSAIDRPMVYVGFRYTFSVENLVAMLNHMSGPEVAAQVLDKVQLVDHLAESWMWTDPGVAFQEIARSGHYLAYEVTIRE